MAKRSRFVTRDPRDRLEHLVRPEDPGFLLLRITNGWQRELDRSLAAVALTHRQYLVLSTVQRLQAEEDDAVSQRTIARAAHLDEGVTSRLVRNLEIRGWLSRGPDGIDSRALRVIITTAGNRVLSDAHLIVHAASRAYLGMPEIVSALRGTVARPRFGA